MIYKFAAALTAVGWSAVSAIDNGKGLTPVRLTFFFMLRVKHALTINF